MSMENGKTRSEIGRHTEQLAEAYLKRQGLHMRERNYRCRGGELDLIMQEQDTLVFVEVRFRKHRAFGGAAASVDWYKQQRLIHAAEHYLQRRKNADMPCRFDVIAVTPDLNGKPEVEWIKNAIEMG